MALQSSKAGNLAFKPSTDQEQESTSLARFELMIEAGLLENVNELRHELKKKEEIIYKMRQQ